MCAYFSCLSFVTKIFGTEGYRNEVLPSFRKLRPQLVPQYAHKTLMSVFECAVFWTQLPPNSNANSVFLLPFSGYESRAAVSVVVHVNGYWYNRLRENQSMAGCTKSQLPITSEIIPWWEYSDIHRRRNDNLPHYLSEDDITLKFVALATMFNIFSIVAMLKLRKFSLTLVFVLASFWVRHTTTA